MRRRFFDRLDFHKNGAWCVELSRGKGEGLEGLGGLGSLGGLGGLEGLGGLG